jgi:hypothetical protein
MESVSSSVIEIHILPNFLNSDDQTVYPTFLCALPNKYKTMMPLEISNPVDLASTMLYLIILHFSADCERLSWARTTCVVYHKTAS